MLKIKNKTIYVTRGDTLIINLVCGNNISFSAGDRINFYIMPKDDMTDAVLAATMDIEMSSASIDMVIDGSVLAQYVDPSDRKVTTLWYEIELVSGNNVSTLVGFDEKGGKELIVYPEAIIG